LTKLGKINKYFKTKEKKKSKLKLKIKDRKYNWLSPKIKRYSGWKIKQKKRSTMNNKQTHMSSFQFFTRQDSESLLTTLFL